MIGRKDALAVKADHILAISIAGWGDLILSLPAIATLVKSDASVMLLTREIYKDFVLAYVPSVTIMTVRSSIIDRIRNLIRILFIRNIGSYIGFEPSNTKFCHAVSLLSRANVRCKADSEKDPKWMRRLYKYPELKGLSHRYGINMALARIVYPTLLVELSYCDVFATTITRASRYILPKIYVVVHIGAGRVDKLVSPDFMDRVIMMLSKFVYVVVVGGMSDICSVRDSEMVRNIVGGTDFVETAEIIRKSRLFISYDTGAAHCASAFGVKQVAVFKSTNAKVVGPYSDNCKVIEYIENDSSVDEFAHMVLSVIRKMINDEK